MYEALKKIKSIVICKVQDGRHANTNNLFDHLLTIAPGRSILLATPRFLHMINPEKKQYNVHQSDAHNFSKGLPRRSKKQRNL